jgi:CRP/FNR family transcriptional regulator, cyclic AMP receptor protein
MECTATHPQNRHLEALGMSTHPLKVGSRTFLKGVGIEETTRNYQDRQAVYSQGDAADAMFQIQVGNVKLVTASPRGKQAVIAVLGPGDMFGEGCLAPRALRVSTATALQLSSITRVKRATLARLIHQDPAFAKQFISFLLARMVRVEEDFVDRLFNFSEKRLARILLMLANNGKDGRGHASLPSFNQEQLAQMVGTTRSRVSHFMNKFRNLGLVDYRGNGALTIHTLLLSGMLQDHSSLKPPATPRRTAR